MPLKRSARQQLNKRDFFEQELAIAVPVDFLSESFVPVHAMNENGKKEIES